MDIIFEGDDLTVFIERGAKDTVVFSFSGYGTHAEKNSRYGDGFLQKLGVTSVFFTTKSDHWWQTDEMPAALDAASAATDGITNRITYGQSMGGFGAAAFARALRARYLITAPQLSVLPERAMLHKVWQDGYAGRKLHFPTAADLLDGASGLIVFDPLHKMDTSHANLLKNLSGQHRRLFVPFGSHFLPRTLTEMGIFSKLITNLIMNEDTDLGTFRREIRGRRLQSSRYIEMLTNALRARRGPGLWLKAERYIQNYVKQHSIAASSQNHLESFLRSYNLGSWGRRKITAEMSRVDEDKILQHPNLLRWWQASSGVNGAEWRCRKTDAALLPKRSSFPMLVHPVSYGGKPALSFASDENQLWDGGCNLLPTDGEVSLVVVGRAGPDNAAFLVGGVDRAGNSSFIVHQSTVDGFVGFAFNAKAPSTVTGGLVGGAARRLSGEGPNLFIGSYNAADAQRTAVRMNCGAFTAAGNPITPGNATSDMTLYVGGLSQSGANEVNGQIRSGDLAEIIVLNTALHTNIDLRDQIEKFLQDRYGLW